MRLLIVSLVKTAEAGRMGWNLRNRKSSADIGSVVQSKWLSTGKYKVNG